MIWSWLRCTPPSVSTWPSCELAHASAAMIAVLHAPHINSGLTQPLPCFFHPLRSLTFFFALNALANYDPYQRWRIRLEYFARKLGCAEDLNSADQYEGEG